MNKKKIFAAFAAGMMLFSVGAASTAMMSNPVSAATKSSTKKLPSVAVTLKKNATVYAAKYSTKTGKISSLKKYGVIAKNTKVSAFFYLKKGSTKYYFLGTQSKKYLVIKSSDAKVAKGKKVLSYADFLKKYATPSKITINVPKFDKIVPGTVVKETKYLTLITGTDGRAALKTSDDTIKQGTKVDIVAKGTFPVSTTDSSGQQQTLNLQLYGILDSNFKLFFVPAGAVELTDKNAQVPSLQQFNTDFANWQKQVNDLIQAAKDKYQNNK